MWEEEITRQVKALLLPPPCSAWATIMGVRAARLMGLAQLVFQGHNLRLAVIGIEGEHAADALLRF